MANSEVAIANMTTATSLVDRQNKSIESLLKMRELDAAVLANLANGNAELAKLASQKQASRTTLEKTNVNVKNFMDSPVPDDLRGLLDAQNAKYNSGNAN